MDIYTIGYTGWKPEALREVVDDFGAILCDIRFSPKSRVPQWRQPELVALVGRERYRWLLGLGNENYNNGAAIKLHNPLASAYYLEQMVGTPIILLCACKNHNLCHRKTAAEYLVNYFSASTNPRVKHLYPNDKLPLS